MTDTKSLLESKTIIGIIISVLGIVANMLHIDLGNQGDLLNDVMALLGAGLALYGRIKAVKKIA